MNAGTLALALTFRPHFAVGYLGFFATAIIAALALSVLFVAACITSIIALFVLSPLGDVSSYVAFACVLPFAFFGGLYYLSKVLIPYFSRWWSGSDETVD